MAERSEDEIRAAAFKLRTEKRMTHRQIADELGIALGRVGEILKGVPASGGDEVPEEKKASQQFMPMLISKEHVAKLYALAMDEGYDDVNNWLKEKMLPWYAVKRGLEWKLHSKIEPKEFETSFEIFLLDSMELRDLKQKLNMLGGQSPVPVIAKTENKGDVKTL